MANFSDNGWPVITEAQAPTHTEKVHVGGRTFIVALGTGELWEAFLTKLNAIEPFSLAGWDGGYSFRLTRGSSTSWSCHASATASDINASRHPRGRRNTFSLAQRAKIRLLLASKVGRAFRWGADFSTVPDDMHFQLRNQSIVQAAMVSVKVPKLSQKDERILKQIQKLAGAVPDGKPGDETRTKVGAMMRGIRANTTSRKPAPYRPGNPHVQRTGALQGLLGVPPLKVPRWGSKSEKTWVKTAKRLGI